ncbi:DUF6894 family protein [Bradyrhizobium sp. CCBAU 53380]|uniref:DUF6894 family protein n=1 Tax=Bradyrhizobium sp. CCBAU 53380 TaxID=1325117 RepID=UPI002302F522|nr:hypothetical protein [Bradyrhizobium sp. CCBAU 53380]MDA9427121.1 hypothetical protein [Bradyrhizobium sp. CCBAU 53380]
MPLYHFDIHYDGGVVIDAEGIDVIDIGAAETLALEVLGQAILDDARNRRTGLTKIEVRDEAGRIVASASATVSLERLLRERSEGE